MKNNINYFQKKYILILFLGSFFCRVFSGDLHLKPVTEWTMLVYVQANNNLNKYALQNFKEMSLVGSTGKLNILVQLHDPSHRGVWRYKIKKGEMFLDSSSPGLGDGNKAEDLVDSMKWAVTKHPAKKYFLVLWNHGIGILDPVWGHSRIAIDQNVLSDNPRIQLAGLTVKSLGLESFLEGSFDRNRGILFNEINRTYMSNSELLKAMKLIKNTVLNKKIDLLGMDACLMAMFGVGYQVKDYADYLIASEEVELANGWPYASFLNPLSKVVMDPVSLAKSIVNSYSDFYKKIKIGFHTLSVMDLGKMSIAKDNLNLVVESVKNCEKYEAAEIKRIVKLSRNSCLSFSTNSYIDLHSFYSEFQKNVKVCIDKLVKTKNKKSNHFSFVKSLKSLNVFLGNAISGIDDLIVANVAGILKKGARGLSIYFPNGKIDSSYIITEFAKDSLWVEFLRKYSS